MKKIFVSILFFVGIAVGIAQVEKEGDRQETDQDKIQQEPQRPVQIDQERAARIEAQLVYNEKNEKKKEKKLARKEAREEARELR